MGLLKSLKKRLTTQYIAVIMYDTTCDVKVLRLKNEKNIFEEKKHFDLPSKDKLSKEAVSYIALLQNEIEQSYVVLFLNTHGQGVVPSCLKSEYEKFHIDYGSVKHICIDKSYSIYASLIDIKWIEKIFSQTGIDFIFSPFLILDTLIKKSEFTQETTLYILSSLDSVTVMIFTGKKFLYGTFINIVKEEDLLGSEFEDEEFAEEILEDGMMEEIDLDLDIEEAGEIVDILDDTSNQAAKIEEKVIEIKNKLYGQDLRLVKYLDASLREFYDSDLYESDFVSQVVFFDGAKINPEVIGYLEEELLVSVHVIPVVLIDQLLQLSQNEVENHA